MGKKRHKITSTNYDLDNKNTSNTWTLDFYRSGGGYRIVKIDNSGKISHPLLSNRLPAKEFVNACLMATEAVTLYKKNKTILLPLKQSNKDKSATDYIKKELWKQSRHPQFDIKKEE